MFNKVKASTINYLLNASIAEKAKQYFKLQLKVKKASLNINFLQQCIKIKVIPKFVQVRTNVRTKAARNAIKVAEKTWIKEEVKFWFYKRDILFTYIKILHCELSYNLHQGEFDLLDDYVREKVSRIAHKKYLTQKKKLESLKNKKNEKKVIISQIKAPADQCFHPSFVNKTSVVFNKSEIAFLNSGPNYSPHISNKFAKEILIVESEIALNNIPDCEYTKFKISNIIKKAKFQNYDKILVKSIKQKIQDNNLIITKADKGNSVVVLEKSSYISKINDFLEDPDIIELKTDPIPKFQKILKSLVNN